MKFNLLIFFNGISQFNIFLITFHNKFINSILIQIFLYGITNISYFINGVKKIKYLNKILKIFYYKQNAIIFGCRERKY